MSPARRACRDDDYLARGLGAGAATFFAPQILAACGGGGGGGSAADLTGINLVKRFPGDILVPGRLRLPFSLATSSGVLAADSTTSIPDVLSFVVTDIAFGGSWDFANKGTMRDALRAGLAGQ